MRHFKLNSVRNSVRNTMRYYVLYSMRYSKSLISAVSIIGMIWISACGEDVQLPAKSLQGVIDSTEWEFTVGKALTDIPNNRYNVELFNFPNFTQNDGCLLFGGTQPFLTVEIPFNARDNQQINAITANLVFHIDGRNQFTADQGFVEVSFINTNEIRGFISAASGDRNEVEGFFSVLICN